METVHVIIEVVVDDDLVDDNLGILIVLVLVNDLVTVVAVAVAVLVLVDHVACSFNLCGQKVDGSIRTIQQKRKIRSCDTDLVATTIACSIAFVVVVVVIVNSNRRRGR